jgi:cytochrome c-type biogenesis protein CcmF
VLPLAGAHWGVAGWVLARPAALLLGCAVLLSAGQPVLVLLAEDFSVLYVAGNSHSDLPMAYKLAAFWGGHEGSMLLWQLMLACWTLAVAWRSRDLPPAFVARVLAVLGWISVGLLLFLLFLSNPFTRLILALPKARTSIPAAGPGMVLHPPLLYMGYVGFAVPFVRAGGTDLGRAGCCLGALVALLDAGGLGLSHAGHSAGQRRGLRAGLGRLVVLGPVENASFMPWLVGTALLHSLIVTDQRGAFRSWSALLAICAFAEPAGHLPRALRVLTSVHAFAVDPGAGSSSCASSWPWWGSRCGCSPGAPGAGPGPGFAMLSRESLLLINNVLFSAAALAVLIGTLYPLALDVLSGEKISVGPPYFEAVFVPLVLPALLLMAVGTVARWKHSTARELWVRLRMPVLWTGVCTTVLVLAEGWLGAQVSAATLLGMALGLWCILGTAGHAAASAPRVGSGQGWQRAAPALGLVGHAGGAHRGGRFHSGGELGQRHGAQAGNHAGAGRVGGAGGLPLPLRQRGPCGRAELRRTACAVQCAHRGADAVADVPGKRVPRPEHAAEPGGHRQQLDADVFLALGEPLDPEGRAWTVRLQIKPFMDWIWVGTLMMALGAGLSLLDRRFRLAQRREPRAALQPLQERSA